MIGKRAAQALARDNRITIGQLRAAIYQARGTLASSAVNPAILRDTACDIYAAALQGRSDADIPQAWRPDPYSPSGALKPSRDFLLVTNILRD